MKLHISAVTLSKINSTASLSDQELEDGLKFYQTLHEMTRQLPEKFSLFHKEVVHELGRLEGFKNARDRHNKLLNKPRFIDKEA